MQQCGDIGRCYYLQEGIGGVVFQAAYLCCGVIEGQAFLGAEVAYGWLVEAFFSDDAESVLIVEVYQAHDAPEVIDPVGVIERHAPAMGLRRETAQEQDLCVLWQEWLKRMLFCVHRPQRYKREPKGTVLFGSLFEKGAKQNRPLWLLEFRLKYASIYKLVMTFI